MVIEEKRLVCHKMGKRREIQYGYGSEKRHIIPATIFRPAPIFFYMSSRMIGVEGVSVTRNSSAGRHRMPRILRRSLPLYNSRSGPRDNLLSGQVNLEASWDALWPHSSPQRHRMYPDRIQQSQLRSLILCARNRDCKGRPCKHSMT